MPPLAREQLGQPLRTLWITEGIKKGDALASRGLAVVDAARRLELRQRRDDWERVALEDRAVNVAFDSDVMDEPAVYGALERIAAFLAAKGARVSFVYLPQTNGKVGVDDFLAAGHTVEELHALAEPELRPPADAEGRAGRSRRCPPRCSSPRSSSTSRGSSSTRPSERHELAALALWVVHTWAIDAADVTPYIYVESRGEGVRQDARAGDARTRSCAGRCAPRASPPPRSSRRSRRERPTLMVDEVDAIFTAKSESAEALRGVLNGGNRRGSPVLRGTQDGEPREYRDVLRRSCSPGSTPAAARHDPRPRDRDRAEAQAPQRAGRAFLPPRRRGADRAGARAARGLGRRERRALAEFRTEPIAEISERLEEAWEPLLAIAALAGGDWPSRARAAAIALAKADLGGDVDYAHLLLAALREVFDGGRACVQGARERVNELDEYPFGGWSDGKGIDAARDREPAPPLRDQAEERRASTRATSRATSATSSRTRGSATSTQRATPTPKRIRATTTAAQRAATPLRRYTPSETALQSRIRL